MFLISLVVLSYIAPLDVNAQVYDVNITNNGVDVNVTSLPNNAYDFSNSLYDANQFDTTDIQFGDDSPLDTYSASGDGGVPYGQSVADFQSISQANPPTSTVNPWRILSPNTGLTQARYFRLVAAYYMFRPTTTMEYGITPLQVHKTDNTDYRVNIKDNFLVPNANARNAFFDFAVFRSDLLTALIGQDNFNFFVRLLNTLNTTVTSTNFSYTVPSIFGFDTGFVIDIPFNDILHGTGDWYGFASLINFFRSMCSFCYYLAVIIIIVRCIFVYN